MSPPSGDRRFVGRRAGHRRPCRRHRRARRSTGAGPRAPPARTPHTSEGRPPLSTPHPRNHPAFPSCRRNRQPTPPSSGLTGRNSFDPMRINRPRSTRRDRPRQSRHTDQSARPDGEAARVSTHSGPPARVGASGAPESLPARQIDGSGTCRAACHEATATAPPDRAHQRDSHRMLMRLFGDRYPAGACRTASHNPREDGATRSTKCRVDGADLCGYLRRVK